MAVIVLTSAGHAPGVTATSLGLALAWPGSVLVADCDRQPTQSVLAGFLQGQDPARRGLGQLLQAHRERRPLEPVIESNLMPLAPQPEGAPSRVFLPGFSHPGMVGLFGHAWPDLMAALARYPGDVLVDAGQIGVSGLPKPLSAGADAVLVVVRTSLVALASLRLYLPLLLESVPEGRLGLVVIGEGRPYDRHEVEGQFGVPIWASVPFEPEAAAAYSEGVGRPKRSVEAAHQRHLTHAAHRITERLAASRRLIGAAR